MPLVSRRGRLDAIPTRVIGEPGHPGGHPKPAITGRVRPRLSEARLLAEVVLGVTSP